MTKRLKMTRGTLQDVLPARREQWLSTLKENPHASRRQLMDIAPSQWEWLRWNDAEWLEQHMPPPLRPRPPVPRIDWASFDAELAVAVKAAALQIRNFPGRPSRVCQAAIAEIVGHKGRMQRRLDKMPLTAKVLAEHLETWDAFAIEPAPSPRAGLLAGQNWRQPILWRYNHLSFRGRNLARQANPARTRPALGSWRCRAL